MKFAVAYHPRLRCFGTVGSIEVPFSSDDLLWLKTIAYLALVLKLQTRFIGTSVGTCKLCKHSSMDQT